MKNIAIGLSFWLMYFELYQLYINNKYVKKINYLEKVNKELKSKNYEFNVKLCKIERKIFEESLNSEELYKLNNDIQKEVEYNKYRCIMGMQAYSN